MSPARSAPHLLPLLLLCPGLRSYEAPQVKQDVFAARACAAFLTFTNAAYLSGVTVELPCYCKPQQVARTHTQTQLSELDINCRSWRPFWSWTRHCLSGPFGGLVLQETSGRLQGDQSAE